MIDGRGDTSYNIGDTVYYIESYLDVASSKIKETTILSISGEHNLYRLSDGQCFHFGEENKVFFKDKIEMLLTLMPCCPRCRFPDRKQQYNRWELLLHSARNPT